MVQTRFLKKQLNNSQLKTVQKTTALRKKQNDNLFSSMDIGEN